MFNRDIDYTPEEQLRIAEAELSDLQWETQITATKTSRVKKQIAIERKQAEIESLQRQVYGEKPSSSMINGCISEGIE